ncbi:MAG: hypothetical protein QCI38_05375 [Candidatus Thermoplasmatota archaeon]|nr:hypothetical protein [Candidatus Thermoplasmatota archaeon]
MKYVLVYWSRFGNNKKIIESLGNKLGAKGEVQILKADEANPSAMPAADIYVFSAAAEKFTIQSDMKKLMKKMQGMEGKKYGIINTHAMKSKNWLGRMEKILSKHDMVKVAETNFHMGPDTDKGNGLGEGWEAKLDEFAAKI